MANETTITVVGNLTYDPESNLTKSKKTVVNFTIATTPRSYDRAKDEWVDGDTLFLRCSIWDTYAENVAASLKKGMRVIAVGRLKQRSYDTADGDKRTVVEMDVDEVGPSLRFGTSEFQSAVQRGGSSKGRR
jgi:single-strand DNA-binding protein